jgi:hypothetical protein
VLDPAELDKLSDAAARQAQQFGWARTAERTLAAYSDAAGLLSDEHLMIAT